MTTLQHVRASVLFLRRRNSADILQTKSSYHKCYGKYMYLKYYNTDRDNILDTLYSVNLEYLVKR